MQLEFRMLDPYVRVNLQHDNKVCILSQTCPCSVSLSVSGMVFLHADLCT